jgi:hypothetical protein
MSENWPGIAFFQYCLASGLAESSARYYATYLRRLDKIVGGLDDLIRQKSALGDVDRFVANLPTSRFRDEKDRSNMLSVLRKYLDFKRQPGRAKTEVEPVVPARTTPAATPSSIHEIRDLFHDVRSLAVRYRRSTGKPLGVTGELAELACADVLGVELAPARTAGFDGWIVRGNRKLRVQIKGRAVPWATRYVGRCPAIKTGDLFELVFLVLIDNETMQPREIWEAEEASVTDRLVKPGSKSRNERNSMGISQFKSIATLIWSADQSEPK